VFKWWEGGFISDPALGWLQIKEVSVYYTSVTKGFPFNNIYFPLGFTWKL
jgi:hypothetical protein